MSVVPLSSILEAPSGGSSTVVPIVGRDRAESYQLDPQFERGLIYLLATKPRFWGKLGYAIDPDCLGCAEARIAFDHISQISRETGRGPEAAYIVVQRIRRLMGEGKATLDDVLLVSDYLIAAEDAKLSEDAAISEMAPILRRRIELQIAREAFHAYGARRNFDAVAKMITASRRLGKADESLGTTMGADVLPFILANGRKDRLLTGIRAYDAQQGGLQRGNLGCILARTSAGKSAALSQFAAFAALDRVDAEAIVKGKNVLFATLELSEAHQLARIYANCANVPTDDILSGTRYREAFCHVKDHSFQALVVKEFEARSTTVDDLESWIETWEDATKKTCEVLFVDYADLLIADAGRNSREYDVQREVFAKLRNLADKRNMWVWTATQSVRTKREDKGFLGTDHSADSLHKPRISDLFITLNPMEKGDATVIFVAKDRLGRSNYAVGPLPTDFDFGRLCAPDAEEDTENLA